MSQKVYSKDMFTLVQENERLVDKPLKTKQLSYFQDAMLRFTKNKNNVVATIILIILILLSIFVPILTPKNLYNQTNSGLTTLPPRVPLLEKLGILNGTKEIRNQPIDYATIDPETGLGYPTGNYQLEYIDMSTLTNSIVVGSERSPLYVGGTNDLYVAVDRIAYSIASKVELTLTPAQTLEVDINKIVGNGVVKLYLAPTKLTSQLTGWDNLTFLGTITEPGLHEITLSDVLTESITDFLVLKYELPQLSERGSDYVSLESIRILNGENEIYAFSGFTLSEFDLFSMGGAIENGRFLRKDAEMTVSTFRYNVYQALFANKPATIGKVEYDRILLENPGMAESIVLDEENPTKVWEFGPGFPLAGVTNVTTLTIAGRPYTNYTVLINGAYQLGFESVPYFYFGTNVFGQDLFTLIWLGLRTSLLLGFMAATVNIIVGIIWGAISAYYGGQVDILMERFTDIWGSFPQITMIGIITVLIGPGFMALFIFMIYDGWIGAAKVTRSQFYRYKGREYVLAARTLGASDKRIIFKHILPNALGTIVTRVVLSIPSVIFLEVNLSFLGFGIGNGQELKIGPISLTGTSIGVILNDGQQQIFAGNLWLVIYPTLIVSILMICFNMFGNALRDALNPQLRGS